MKQKIDSIINGRVLKDSVLVKVSSISKYDDHQVEIRYAHTGQLIWRAWDFEPDFEKELERNLKQFLS